MKTLIGDWRVHDQLAEAFDKWHDSNYSLNLKFNIYLRRLWRGLFWTKEERESLEKYKLQLEKEFLSAFVSSKLSAMTYLSSADAIKNNKEPKTFLTDGYILNKDLCDELRYFYGLESEDGKILLSLLAESLHKFIKEANEDFSLDSDNRYFIRLEPDGKAYIFPSESKIQEIKEFQASLVRFDRK